MIWSVFEKVSQSNFRFKVLDIFVANMHSVKMPVGFGHAKKTMCRPLSVMAHLKKSNGEVKAADNCFAHALIIAIARKDNESNYKSYRDCWKIRPVVKNLLETTDIDLTNGVVIPERAMFQEQFREHKIVVYQDLNFIPRTHQVLLNQHLTTDQTAGHLNAPYAHVEA